jgi:uncharacterized SAM-binding protein YcdF (DUF218 family)
LLAVCAALLAVAWLFRAPLLVGLAKAWIVEDPLTRSDVIVVLGGGPSTRPFEAVRLFQQGLAPSVLTMKPRFDPAAKLGLTSSEAEVIRKILVQQGVADASVLCSDDEVANTYEESIAVRNWSRTNHVKTMIIVTDSFHARRVRWLFRKQFKDTGVHVLVRALPVREYKTEDWWQHEQGIVAFQNEVLKYAYYRFKY